MKKALFCLFLLVLGAACILGPAATLPAMACGANSGCCQGGCNCGMSAQTPEMPVATAPVVSMASFDPSLAVVAAKLSEPQAPQSYSSDTERPHERSSKDKIYDSQSNLRL